MTQTEVLDELRALIVERLKQYSETGKPNPLFAFATR